MMLMRKKARIPTIIGLIFIIGVLFLTGFFINKTTQFFGKAQTSILPKNVLITNLSDTKFSVSFITKEATIGFLSYGLKSNSLDRIIKDDKDAFYQKEEPTTVHYITLTNLKPETAYYFKIGSGKKTFGSKEKISKISNSCSDYLEISFLGEPFNLKTLPNKMISCREIPLNGEVLTSQKLPAYGGIVCFDIENLLPVSDYIKRNGKWVVPCYNLALKNLSGFLEKLENNLIENIYIEAGKNGKTFVKNKTGNDNPVPLIALGVSNYDFSQKPLIAPINISERTSPTPEATVTPLTLSAPKGNIADDLPTFRGKGKPNQAIKIEVYSDKPLIATIVVDQNGNWSWTPPKNLTPGNHTVIISATDEFGNKQIITNNFTIIAAPNPLLPIYTGTQSAQPTATPKLSPTKSLLPTPTQILEEPTPTEIPEVTPETTDSGRLMNTANYFPLILLLTFTIISFTIGLRLFKRHEDH